MSLSDQERHLPISLAVSSLDMLRDVAEFAVRTWIFWRIFCRDHIHPAAKKSIVPDILTAGSSQVGIRFRTTSLPSGCR